MKPQHAPINQFPIENDALIFADRPITQWIDELGIRAPAYLYDKQVIKNTVQTLKQQLPSNIALHYAIKANPMPELVQFIAEHIDGFDVASAGELEIALQTNKSTQDISFAGPGKSELEIHFAIESEITLTIESENELDRCLSIAQQLNIKPNLALRINPNFELKSSGMRMGGGSSPFGVDAEQAPSLIQKMLAADCHLRGLHIYAGSQSLSEQHLIETQKACIELALSLQKQTGMELQWLNIGGGFGIPYFPGDKALDISPIGEQLAIQQKKLPSDTELIIELGRYLVGQAGIYICQVLDRKISRDETFIITNGGLHHHLAASGNFGQLIRKNYPVIKLNQVNQGTREIVTIVGPLCTPLDRLADKIEIAKLDIGDHIGILQSGAYGYTASPHQFLSHPMPLQYLL